MSALVANLGLCALASLFLLGGLNKILNWQATIDQMQEVGLAPAALLLPLTVMLEIGGGAALIYGRMPGAVLGVMLAVFTVATNLVFHRFWELSGEMAGLELSLFFKNVSIAGGLLFVAVHHWNAVFADATARGALPQDG